jgi:DNA-binding response OmpR family regulator
LVVQPDLAMPQRVSDTLRRVGFEVDEASSLAAALDALARRTYQAIVVDYDMPELAGVDLLAALRGAAAATPRILCAVVTPEIRAEARKFGVLAVLDKPISLERLIVTVGAAAGRAPREA